MCSYPLKFSAGEILRYSQMFNYLIFMIMRKYTIFKDKEWYNRKYDGRRKEFKGISKDDFAAAVKKAIYRRFIRSRYDYRSDVRRAYEYIKDRCRPENGSYQKMPMYGNTYLYLCSPVYGHSDYNKARVLKIKGNEKKCEFLIRVANRINNKK